VVTHDQEEALALADRIAVMSAGRIEQVGTPVEVYEYPRTRFVSKFIGTSNFFERRMHGVNGSSVGFPTTAGIDLDISLGPEVSLANVASVMVRPEKIDMHVEPPKETHRNVFAGVVKHIVYQGNFTRVIASVGQAEVIVVAQNLAQRTGPEQLRLGQEIYLCIRPESVRAFMDGGDDGVAGLE